MGKNRHSKDRMFITATEWKSIGGKRTASQHDYRALPFDHCAMSLSPYETPCCTANEGVVFDVTNLVPYVMKHKKNPVTGEKMSTNDIIRLNMTKNTENLWHCPVTCKVFNNNTYIVAIKTTGNVFSHDAVSELNIKAKNYTDLLSGEKFMKSDIITLQNPSDPDHMARRDIGSFVHLQQIRDENKVARQSDSKVRQNPVMENVMKELELKKITDEELEKNAMLQTSSSSSRYEGDADDVKDLLSLNPTTEDVNLGRQLTSGKMGSSLTSSSTECWTSNTVRMANIEELREARWKKMRQVGKKGYVQLQTSLGNLNLELHCDIAMRTTWNFITLCQRGFYDGVPFHRLVPGFMLQGGDPSGTGSGGESAWGKGRPFRDEFDPRIKHDSRGVLSMANSGDHSNGSQFFLTLKNTSHLDYKHSVFGKLVGGAAVLDRIEAVGADKKERPLQEVIIHKTIVMTNPIDEADKLLIAEISANIEKRLSSIKKTSMPTSKSNALYKDGEKAEKYLRVKSSSTTSANDSSGNLSAISDRSSTDEFAIISSSTASLPAASKGPIIGKYMTHPISDKKQTIIANGIEDGREVTLTKQKNVSKTFTDFSGW